MHYTWTTGPLLVSTALRRSTAGADYWEGVGSFTWAFYDGLGRLVETQVADGDWVPGQSDGHEVETYMVYDALGRVVRQHGMRGVLQEAWL